MPWYAWRLLVEPAAQPRDAVQWRRSVVRLVLDQRSRPELADDLSDIAVLRVYDEMAAFALRYADSLAVAALVDALAPRTSQRSVPRDDQGAAPG